MNQVLTFVCIIIWVFNLLGSTGYLFYYHEPQFAIANILASAMALPWLIDKIKKYIK